MTFQGIFLKITTVIFFTFTVPLDELGNTTYNFDPSLGDRSCQGSFEYLYMCLYLCIRYFMYFYNFYRWRSITLILTEQKKI